MKMQKSIIFFKKYLEINMWKIKNKSQDHCHYIGQYNLKYSVPKKIPIALHNWYNWLSFYHKRVSGRIAKNSLLVEQKTLKNT